jgi:hypothetical protein
MLASLKRRWRLVACLAAVTVSLLGILLWLGAELDQRKTDEVGYQQIKNGMTADEVSALLGQPYSTVGALAPLAGPKWQHWLRDDYQIAVYYDGEGHVDQKQFTEHAEQTIWEKAINRVRRGWNRLRR